MAGMWIALLTATVLVSSALTGLAGVTANLAWILVGVALTFWGKERRYLLAASALFVSFLAAEIDLLAIGIAKIAAVCGIVLIKEVLAANIELWSRLRATGRKPWNVAFMTARRWAILGLILALGVVTSRQCGDIFERLVLESTPLDAWCDVQEVKGTRRIPCTGMSTVATTEMEEVDLDQDLKRFVLVRFQAQRKVMASMPIERLRAVAAEPDQFWQQVDPARILGLPKSVKYEPEMLPVNRDYDAHMRALPGHVPHRICRPVNDNDYDCPVNSTWSIKKKKLQAQRNAIRNKLWAERTAGLSDAERQVALRRDELAEKLTELAKPINFDPKKTPLEIDDAERDKLLRLAAVRALVDSERESIKFLRDAARSRGAAILQDIGAQRNCELVPSLLEGQNNFGSFACIDSGDRTSRLELVPLSFRDSVLVSLDRMHAEAAIRADEDLMSRDDQIEQGGEQAKEAVKGLINLVPKEIRISRREYGGTKFLNRFVNRAIGLVEEAYRTARATWARRTMKKTDVAVVETELSAKQQVDAVRLNMDVRLEASRAETHNMAKTFFLIGDWWDIVFWVTLFIVIIKSLTYVAALELFHSDEQLTIRLRTESTAEGTTRSDDPSLTIDPQFQQPMNTIRQLGNSTYTRRRPPWPTWAVFSRILRRKYFTYFDGRYLPELSAEGMVAGSDEPGKAVLEWKMVENEEVVFDIKDFFGASENVEMRTEFSFQLATLLLGRIRFHYAKCREGEGRLLLIARVAAVQQSQLRTIPVEQLVAWNRHMCFTAHSHRTAWGTLINGFTLVRDIQHGRNSGIWVTAPAADEKWGAIRFAKRLFRPLM
jgi:hypothetical protein